MQKRREKGKWGLKIRNYQAGSIYSYSLGVRKHYDYKDAMLTNSMFTNFIKNNGLHIHNGESTRDIICIDFGYGSRSYDQEMAFIRKTALRVYNDPKLSEEQRQKRMESLNSHIDDATDKKDKFDRKTPEEIRYIFYTKGVDIDYYHYESDVKIIDESIHYKMLYRTPGKAKTNKCMFIREDLFDVAKHYLHMGIVLPKENAPVVEIGAYSSLITSTIDITIGNHGTIAIAPEEILILKDVDSFFNTKVISVETDSNRHCYAKDIDNYPVKNTLFDGEALIDSSIFPEDGDGYILLRQHFTKCAAFCSHIQKYFKDYYGDSYHNVYIKDMFGRQVKADNIKLITTDNAVKWLKFDGVTFDDWSDWIRKGNNLWGIVKTAHKSKFGDVQRMSYQMINALDINTMDSVCQKSLDYIKLLKVDDNVFLQYLKDNANFSNDYDVLLALVEQNPKFLQSDYFKSRKKFIIFSYVKNFKRGKVLQNGDNLVIVQNPFGLLMYAVGEDPLQDPTFKTEEIGIQCWTNRFPDDTYLAEFRNPFNSRNNLGYMHNVYNWRFDEYFELGDLCIAVNCNHTDFEDRNNGSDADSDSIFVTDHKAIVEHAKFCHENYPTIVNNIPKEKNHYDSSLESFALIDNKLGSSQLSIGLSSNLAQISLSYSYNYPDRKYRDCVVILSVIAQAAIDNSKRTYDIDIVDEIERLKQILDVENNKYPEFWASIRKGFSRDRINSELKCPMNVLHRIKPKKFRSESSSIPVELFLKKFDLNESKVKSTKVEHLIQSYSFDLFNYRKIDKSNDEKREEAMFLLRSDFDKLIEDLRTVYFSKNYLGLMSWLIHRAFLDECCDDLDSGSDLSKMRNNRSILLKVLYEVSPKSLLMCFSNDPVIDNLCSIS